MTPLDNTPVATWRVHRVLMLAALLLLVFLFAVYLVYANNLINFPFDYDQGEGFELVDTIMFSQGQWPYQNTDSYPFYSSNYPPLFHVIAAPFVLLFGPAYWYGRLLSFVATLLTAGVIGYAVQRESGYRWIAALSGLAFLASNTVYHVGPLVRQHMTMVFFETLAVVVLARAFPERRRGGIALGLLLLVAAGYTKQLAAITAVAVLLWMAIRNLRRAVIWGMGFTVVGVLIFAWMTVATNGEWWRQAIVANVNQFQPYQAIGLFVLWFQLHGFLIVPAALLVVYELYFDRLSLYSVWFVLATIIGGLGSGTWGAGDSYFATAIAAMCILSGIFVARTLNQTWSFRDNYVKRLLMPLSGIVRNRIAVLVVIPLLYVGYGLGVFHMPTTGPVFEQIASVLAIEPNIPKQNSTFYDSASFDVVGYANIGYLVTQADIDAGMTIAEMIRDAEQPVMSEEAGFSIVAGKDVITNPTQLLNLDRAGLFDGTELIDMIENQEFAFIVLRAQFYPQSVLEAIGQHYTRAETITMNTFEYLILWPEDAP